MSSEIYDKNLTQIPSNNFLNAPSLSHCRNKKNSSQTSKKPESSTTESPFGQTTCTKASDVSIFQEEHNSFLSRDENTDGPTLDKILGSTFRQIDLTTIQDFSSELFPNRPVMSNQKVKAYTRKAEIPEIPLNNEKDDKESRHQHENIDEGNSKASTSMISNELNSSRFAKKDSLKSLILEKIDKASQGLFTKPRDKSVENAVLRQRVKVKGLVKENSSNSPTPLKTKNKFIESKRNIIENYGEIGGVSPTKSTECSIERRKLRPPRNTLKKLEDDSRGSSLGVEGKSIDWHNKPIFNKNGSQSFLDKLPEKRPSINYIGVTEEGTGKGHLKILQMLNATGSLNKQTEEAIVKHGKPHGEEDLRGEQWELFKKYGAKFGIKAQECKKLIGYIEIIKIDFGLNTANNSIIEAKVINFQLKPKKVPTPFLKKRTYGETDLYRIRALNNSLIKQV